MDKDLGEEEVTGINEAIISVDQVKCKGNKI